MLFFRRAPSVLAGPGRTSNPLTALLRTPRREGRLRAMQVIDELVTAGVWESPSQALPLPLSCGAFDTLLFGTNMTEFVKIWLGPGDRGQRRSHFRCHAGLRQ